MTKLELFLILFLVEYLKEILIPKTNNILKHKMDPGKFIHCLGCWFYMSLWVRVSNRRNWWSTTKLKMSEGVPFRLNNYMSRTRLEGILGYLRYTDKVCLIL